MPISWGDVDWYDMGRRNDGCAVTSLKGFNPSTLTRRRHKMADTEKRIEVVKLLQALRQNDEKPGDTILRALRRANEEREEDD